MNERLKRRQLLENIREVIRLCIVVLILLILLNKLFFHVDLIDHYKAAAAVGNGIKPAVSLDDDEAAVFYIDTGQSDSTLIMTGTHAVLIDGGDLDSGNITVGAIKALGINRLDYVIISHPHVDHFGGFIDIMRDIPIEKVLMPEIPDDMIPRTMNYSKLLAAMKQYGVSSEFVKTSDCFDLGSNSRLEIAAPLYNDYNELNNLSVAARFVHGENVFLFMGDMESAAEQDLLNADIRLTADVLKIGHHGSAGSNSADFLKAVSPKIAIAESGAYNTYGHPRTAVIERLIEAGCESLCTTSLNGNIAVISNGSELRIQTEKESVISLVNYC